MTVSTAVEGEYENKIYIVRLVTLRVLAILLVSSSANLRSLIVFLSIHPHTILLPGLSLSSSTSLLFLSFVLPSAPCAFPTMLCSLALVSSLVGLAVATPLESPLLSERQTTNSTCSGNTASTRSEWCDYSIDTDYYTTAPDTGVTREYWVGSYALLQCSYFILDMASSNPAE